MKPFTAAMKPFYLFLLFWGSFTLPAGAQGNLMIMPRRVVFDSPRKTQELNLVNIGRDTATYAISFIQIRMKEDGSFEEIKEPDSAQQFASRFVRYFPRTVTLAPNEAQTVRVQVSRSSDLTEGEYRSHLYFRAVPKIRPLGEKEPKDSTISIRLVPIFGVTIPVIIKVGSSTTTVSLSDARVTVDSSDKAIMEMTINRKGNMSVYGDILVDYITPRDKVVRVGHVKGLAVYTPNALRRYRMLLEKGPGVNYRKGKLRVQYVDHSPKPVVLAESELILN